VWLIVAYLLGVVELLLLWAIWQEVRQVRKQKQQGPIVGSR